MLLFAANDWSKISLSQYEIHSLQQTYISWNNLEALHVKFWVEGGIKNSDGISELGKIIGPMCVYLSIQPSPHFHLTPPSHVFYSTHHGISIELTLTVTP